MNTYTKVTFYVGTRFDYQGNAISDADARLENAKQVMLSTYGGYTLTLGQGGWKNNVGKVVEESCAVFVAVTDARYIDHADVAFQLRVCLNQESVLMEIQPVCARFI